VISPEEFEELARNIVGGTEETLVSGVNERLVSSLIQGGQLTAADWRDIEQLAQANHEALQQLLLETRTPIANEVKAAIQEAQALSAANDLIPLRSLYGSVATPSATQLFKRVSAQTVEGVQSIIARQNIKFVQDAERLWYEVAGEAVTSKNHGLETQDAIIKRAVRRLSEEGLRFIEYKSGVHTSIDAAIRRHVISQAGQASGRITMGYMDEFAHDLVFTSAHFGARPEHEVWQGKAYSLTGPKAQGGVTYPNFYRATEYGDVAGLLGVNCRHSFGPYYPGITELPAVPEKRDGMTSEERYRQVQKQRGYERAIRDKKRAVHNAELTGADPTQFRLELGKKQRQLKAHTEKYNLVREPRREKAYGIGAQPRGLRSARLHRRTMSAERMGGMGDTLNAVNWTRVKSPEFRKAFDAITDDSKLNALLHSESLRILEHRNNTDFEDLVIINRTKHVVVGRSTNATEAGSARYTEDLKRRIVRAQTAGDELVALHNHPNSYPPSYHDIASVKGHGYSKSLAIGHNGDLYCIDRVSNSFQRYHHAETYSRFIEAGNSEKKSAILSLDYLKKLRLIAFRRWLL
jgi:hypothetical protein